MTSRGTTSFSRNTLLHGARYDWRFQKLLSDFGSQIKLFCPCLPEGRTLNFSGQQPVRAYTEYCPCFTHKYERTANCPKVPKCRHAFLAQLLLPTPRCGCTFHGVSPENFVLPTQVSVQPPPPPPSAFFVSETFKTELKTAEATTLLKMLRNFDFGPRNAHEEKQ